MNSKIITEPSLTLEERIPAFAQLGELLGYASLNVVSPTETFISEYPQLSESLKNAGFHNPWFTPESISFSLDVWNKALNHEAIYSWTEAYSKEINRVIPKNIAVIMAGNIPLVGFHDFLCTLITGHRFIGKLSSDDKILLPAIANELCKIEPRFQDLIQFTEETLKSFDAVIATGSNNTARYFEYYFSKYPHVIRKNRNGVAVLSGDESEEAFVRLGSDICTYFGLGCRNVSKIFLPKGFDPARLFVAIEPYIKVLSVHFKYMNNYNYYRSIYLLNNTPHLDNGVFIITESEKYSSPIPVLFYEFYDDIETLKDKLALDDELIQCIANDTLNGNNTVALGSTQHPGLSDYADGVDTVRFLVELQSF